jgi:hypothetical protein
MAYFYADLGCERTGTIDPRCRLQVRCSKVVAEDAQRELDDEEQYTTSRREPKDLGEETRVESCDTFLASDESKGGEGPVVLGRLTCDLYDVMELGGDVGGGGGRLTLMEF